MLAAAAPPAPDAARSPRASSFTAATWNVFIGTPLRLPYADYVPLLGSPGEGAARLAAQLAAVKGALTDIFALQELHDDGVAAAFGAAFAGTHDLLASRAANARGAAAFLLWRGALGGGFGAAAGFLAAAAGAGALLCAALALLAAAAAALLLAPRQCVAAQFMLSRTVGGLGLLVDRARWRVLAFETRAFSHQAGDALNALKPRAFAAALLEERAGARARLLVLHAHASLGAHAHRGRQIAEAAAAAAPAAVAALLARARAGGADARAPLGPCDVPCVFLGDLNAEYGACVARAVEPLGFADAFAAAKGAPGAATWSNANPLAGRGVLREPDARVDHVLWRPAAGAAAPAAARLVLDAPPFLSDHFGLRVDFAARAEVAPGPLDDAARAGALSPSDAGVSVAGDPE